MSKWISGSKSRPISPKTTVQRVSLKLCSTPIGISINTVLSIFCTILVSAAVAERKFSAMKRVKTWLRNSMTEIRLTGLTLMHIHKDILTAVTEIVRDFDPLHDRRIYLAFHSVEQTK